MSLKALKWLFAMCVRPKLTYASHIWAMKLTDLQKEELRKINALGCRLLAPCWRSTPRMTMEIMWNMLPMHIFAKGTALATFHRIKPLIRQYLKGDIGYQKGHLRDLMSECEDNDLTIEVDNKMEKKFWEKGYKVNQFQDMDWIQLLEDNGVRYVYTDGSGINGNFGSGFAIRYNCQVEDIASVTIGENRTVYQAELKAIDLATDCLLKSKHHAVRTEFRVDNQSVLSRLKSGIATNELETQCIEKLIRLNMKTRVLFRWIKSHKGIQGNELADGLARVGAGPPEIPALPERTVELTPHVPLPSSYLKEKIRHYMNINWLKEWQNLIGTKFRHRNSKFWLSNPDPKNITKEMMKLSRTDASLVLRLITGHNNTKEHRKRTNKLEENETTECRLCLDSEETNEHLLECHELRYERVLAFGTSDKEQIQKYWNVKNIAQFCRNDKVKGLLMNLETDEMI